MRIVGISNGQLEVALVRRETFGHTEEAALLVKIIAEFVARKACYPADLANYARVKVARTCSHRYTAQRSEAHRSIDADAVLNRRNR